MTAPATVTADWWLVKLEFERVQTFLFAVPELRAMIGANALMGEVLRGTLAAGTFVEQEGQRNLPVLARLDANGNQPPQPDFFDPGDFPGPIEGD